MNYRLRTFNRQSSKLDVRTMKVVQRQGGGYSEEQVPNFASNLVV